MEATIRDRSVDDAESFWHILNSDNFKFFGKPPKDVQGEREYIENEMKNPLIKNYTILYGGEIVGGIGIKINPYRDWIGEIGYFVSDQYWNKGIATKALSLVEEKAKELGLKRVELVIDTENLQSISVATKSNYAVQGFMSRKLKHPREGGFRDGLVYGKLID